MRRFEFIIPGEPLTRQSREDQVGYLTALEANAGHWGAKGTVGLGFVWISDKKQRNKLLRPLKNHIIWALQKATILDRNAMPYNLFNLEQRVKPAYGAKPEGRITLTEESE